MIGKSGEGGNERGGFRGRSGIGEQAKGVNS